MNSRTEPASRPVHGGAAIVLDRVVRRFGDLTAVDGLSTSIPRGICYALLGPNGAGKTTVSRMIGAVLPRHGGTIRVLGRDPWREQSEVKARIGVVMQHDAFDEDLNVLQNLRVHGLFYWLKGPAFRARIRELLEFVSLDGREGMRIQALSGGMKRRLLIARALLSEPEILLLDEPTTGLDPQVRQVIWALLRKLKEEGMTILLTTHYMEEAAQLDRGALIAEDTPAALIERTLPAYALEFDVRHGPAQEAFAGRRLVDRHGDRVYVYEDEERVLREWLTEHAVVSAQLRPTSLEDVFLRMTGRGLHE